MAGIARVPLIGIWYAPGEVRYLAGRRRMNFCFRKIEFREFAGPRRMQYPIRPRRLADSRYCDSAIAIFPHGIPLSFFSSDQ